MMLILTGIRAGESSTSRLGSLGIPSGGLKVGVVGEAWQSRPHRSSPHHLVPHPDVPVPVLRQLPLPLLSLHPVQFMKVTEGAGCDVAR